MLVSLTYMRTGSAPRSVLIVMAYIVMAYIVMIYVGMALYSYGTQVRRQYQSFDDLGNIGGTQAGLDHSLMCV